MHLRLHHALSLEERVEVLRRSTLADCPSLSPSPDSTFRLRSWRESLSLEGDSFIQEWEQAHGISEKEMEDLLLRLPEDLCGLKEPGPFAEDWILAEKLRREMADLSSQSSLHLNESELWFLAPVLPVVKLFLQRFQEGVRKLEIPPNILNSETKAVGLFLPLLSRTLFRQMHRTVILEINSYRMMGKLRGDSPEERFKDYARKMEEFENRLAFLEDYPLLCRTVHTSLRYWLHTSIEFLSRLKADWSEFQSFFPKTDIGPFVGFAGEAGDAHGQGRRVLIVQFQGGGRLVYKPHSVALDVHFQELQRWLMRQGLTHDLRVLHILEKGDYGWIEFVPPLSCDSQNEVELFYRRMGNLLALAYALGSTDLHCENLIAHGSYPVIVDVETIFHPKLEAFSEESMDDLVNKVIHDSVLTSDLLPLPMGQNLAVAADISGIGGRPKQPTPIPITEITNPGTDQIRVSKGIGYTGETTNQPQLKSSSQGVIVQGDSILKGFEEAYHILLERKDELLPSEGPLSQFRNDPVRLVIRSTREYSAILNDSYHPDVGKDSLDRERVLNRLWSKTQRRPSLRPFVLFERDQLAQGDIPYFVTKPFSKEVWTLEGRQVPTDLFQSAGDTALERINRLSLEDLRRQQQIIRSSLASLSSFAPVSLTTERIFRGEANRAPSPLELAEVIGESLLEAAVRRNGSASWLSLVTCGKHESRESYLYRVGHVASEMYDGLAGIAFFLMYLGKISGKQVFTELSDEASQTLADRIARNPPSKSICGFSGWSSLLYFWAHRGAISGDNTAWKNAEEILCRIEPLIQSTDDLDLMGGLAGCALALLSLHRGRPESGAGQLAIQCVEKILAAATPQEVGIGWSGRRFQRGFSHGISGIAYALDTVGVALGIPEFSAAAKRAVLWENFLLSEGVWTDFQPVDQVHQCSWCHGRAGIALARLRLYLNSGQAEMRDMAVATLNSIKQVIRQPANHCLCHGTLGNLETLIQAKEILLFDSRWKTLLDGQVQELQREVTLHGFKTSFPLHDQSPGLMTGLAGIGYGLLRLAQPFQVPSVLILESAKA